MHKIDLINRLKKSEPHNEAHYQRQLEQQLVQHDDVIHRLTDIMKTDDYFSRKEDLPMVDPLVAYEEVEQFPELFDAKEAVSRISTEVDIIERQMHQPGMYPIPLLPVPTTSGFVPHKPNSAFKPISPATPSPATGSSQPGSFNSLLDQVNSTQNGSPSSGSSIPCAQRSPATKQNSSTSTQQGTPTHSQSTQSQQVPNQQNATTQQQFASPTANMQNVAPPQPFAPVPQSFQQSPVAHQQQQPLLQPPAPSSHAAHQQQGQLQFIQPMVSPQSQPIRQPLPFRQGFNHSAQPFIPAAEAQQNPVPNTQEPRILMSADGQGVKSSSTMDKTCFRCKQPGHSKRTVQNNPTAPNVEPEVTFQPSVL